MTFLLSSAFHRARLFLPGNLLFERFITFEKSAMPRDKCERNVKSDVIFSNKKNVVRVSARIKRVDDFGQLLRACRFDIAGSW